MDRPLGTGLPAPGDRIADKYDVIRVVGEGGMGIVYEVMHTRLQQRAAIKMLQPRVQAMPDVAGRFEREARAACRLKSRHAVRITDVDHDDRGRAYMVMEFLEGHDLAEELNARGRLPVAEAVDALLQSCIAMAEAHASGVVHRDLKPSNLFLVREGGERIVKVLDFGISKLTAEGEAAVTSTFATMGTPLYMSPEQIRSTKNVDGRTDIWSLGVILFEVLAGERPFQGTTTAAAAAIVADDPPLLRTLVAEVPEGLEAAVAKALAKKAEDRFADVRAFAEALAPFGTSRDPLRAIEALAGPAGQSFRPTAPRAASGPSFAHAETVAQTTPPPIRSGSLSAPQSAARSAEPPMVSPAASTEAAWATQRVSGGRGGRAAKVAIGVALLAVAVGIGIRLRVRSAPPSLPAPSVGIAVAPTPVPVPVPLPVPGSASPSASAPASASASASASRSGTGTGTGTLGSGSGVGAALAPEPSPHSHPKPRTPPSHPVSSPASPPPPTAAPTSNPLHL